MSRRAGSQPVVDMPVFGLQGATDSAQVAANVVRFSFADDQLSGGEASFIDVVSDGLDLHGTTMPLPQSGVVG